MPPLHDTGMLALLDRDGRIWTLILPNLFTHEGRMRTEREIRDAWDPVIQVRDPSVLTTRLTPTPAGLIAVGDVVVLPGTGMLSRVVGIFSDPVQHPGDPWLFVCGENDDWAHRPARSPLLRAATPPEDV